MATYIVLWIFAEDLGWKNIDVVGWHESKAMEILDISGSCQFSQDINQITAPLTSILWDSENESMKGEILVSNDNVGNKRG